MATQELVVPKSIPITSPASVLFNLICEMPPKEDFETVDLAKELTPLDDVKPRRRPSWSAILLLYLISKSYYSKTEMKMRWKLNCIKSTFFLAVRLSTSWRRGEIFFTPTFCHWWRRQTYDRCGVSRWDTLYNIFQWNLLPPLHTGSFQHSVGLPHQNYSASGKMRQVYYRAGKKFDTERRRLLAITTDD